MSLEDLFGWMSADKNSKLTGIGSDPTVIGNMGNSLNRIREKMKLPEKIDAQAVIKAEKALGKVKAELELGNELVTKQSQELEQLTQLHQINTKFAATTMKIDQKVREIQSGHEQEVSKYRLGVAETQAWLDGYQEAYNLSGEIFQ